MAKRYLSGVQPSGDLHLGNYFGAIRKHVANQDDAFYFIADWHALTTVHDAKALRASVRDVAATYLALGLDPARACLYRQSDVPEVPELAWFLSTVAPMGLLERAVSYKDKVAKGIDASVGLFNYPVLMAADILACEADVVPVGPDQVQHMEMTRDMAGSWNARYGDTFKLPGFELGTAVSVPGIDGGKMSKSVGNTIPLFATGAPLRKRVMSIKTDSTPVDAPKDPDRCTIFALWSLFAAPAEIPEMRERYAKGIRYGDAKETLYQRIESHFADARARRAQLTDEAIDETLRRGAARARSIAGPLLDRVRKACGIR